MTSMQRSGQVEKRLYRIPEACELLSLSRAELYRRAQAGEIRFTRVGTAVRIAAEDLDHFVELKRSET